MAGKYMQVTMFKKYTGVISKLTMNIINSISLKQAGRSLILFMMKNREPSIEPCSMPQICLKASDF